MLRKQQKILLKVCVLSNSNRKYIYLIRLGLLTVDPSKRLTIKDLSRNPWLRGSSIPATHDHLMTPSILCQASRSLIVYNFEKKDVNNV
jgi:hypothetical protein